MDKLNVVYVIVSSGEDFFCKQLLISILSLRYRMENKVNIILLTESSTKEYLETGKNKILDLIDELVEQKLDDKYSAGAKSRILKTIMRNVINGDFLYIDCDTVICENLESIKFFQHSCAVLDNHQSVNKEINEFKICVRNAEKMGYSVGYQGKHMNSGVIWCKDDNVTRNFFENWYKLWLQGYDNGIYIDQLSFNEVNNRMDGVIHEMEGIWNCQLRYGIRFLAEAKILHYFASNMNDGCKYGYYLTNKKFLNELKINEEIPERFVKIIISPRCAFGTPIIEDINSENYIIINSNVGALCRIILKRTPQFFDLFNRFLGYFKKDR